MLGPLAAIAVALGGKPAVIAIAGLLALIVAVYIGMRHPLWLYYGTVIFVTAFPFGYFPGVHLPIYLVLGCGSVLAFLLYPRAVRRRSPLMTAVLVLILMSALSMIVTFSAPVNIMDFAKWGIATGFMFVLLALPNDQLRGIGKAVVYSCTFSGVMGAIAVAQGTTKWVYAPFSIIGYYAADRFYITGGTHTLPKSGRFDVGEGSETFQRLGGMWADPNAAGIGLVIGIALAAILFTGWQRVTLMSLLSVCIVLTLSRAALSSVLVGVALVFIFHKMRSRDRQLMIATLFVGFAAAMSIPAVRKRLTGSLGENDAGASDRIAAIREFPMRLGDHWIFGRGWSLREFKDGPYAFTENFVSNAPLIAVHRGGLVAGLSFVAVIIIGCVVAAKLIRSDSLPHAFFGGVFMAFSIIALNLDHPVVVIAQMAFMYTFFLTFLQYADEQRKEGALDSPKVAAAPMSKPVAAQQPKLPATTAQ
ncbi:hypothetical protein H7J86_08030 [Mycobacterium hackensackense]|uniref:O-antigen ligase family protein n=1 Tax=Mycobacterium hackensackense TaxID=228909 RepID=UPI002265A947|nr:O-antigen ligase family protein [Mycobacterium hackensackense]MCV7252109.1 hypothetical protein [Mycobacterium hackensackense]